MRSTGLIVLALTPFVGLAQNLAVNPSFEEITACPNDISQVDLVEGWTNLFISPDYFNACADDTASVPFNALGYQMPSDGNGYAGIGTYPLGSQEYLQGELTDALEPGMLTYVSMRISPGGFGYATWTSPRFAASHVGLRFSVEPLDFLTSYDALHVNTAVLYMPAVLNDTAVWTVLSTAFIPDSAYRYVQIGTFFTDSLVSWTMLDPAGDWDVAYALIDMVCVATQPGICDPVMGMAEQPVGRVPHGLALEEELLLPLAAWGLEGLVEQVWLVDGIGRLVEIGPVAPNGIPHAYSVAHLAPGAYFIRLLLRDRSSVVIRCSKT